MSGFYNEDKRFRGEAYIPDKTVGQWDVQIQSFPVPPWPDKPLYSVGRSRTTIYRGEEEQPCAWVPGDIDLAAHIVALLNRERAAPVESPISGAAAGISTQMVGTGTEPDRYQDPARLPLRDERP
jgi:hypothetical protein